MVSKKNNKIKFIFESMKYCLRNNIISEELSQHPMWEKLKIEITDCDEKIYFHDSIEEYWNFKFKKVILPERWKMLGHGNDEDRGMNPQVIIIDYSVDPPKMKGQVVPFFEGLDSTDYSNIWFSQWMK